MKRSLHAVLVFCIALTAAHFSYAADEIEIGDTKEKVIETLGKPRGVMKRGKSEYLTYKRGLVRITDGKVTMIKLDSVTVANEKDRRRKEIHSAKQKAKAEAKAKRLHIARGRKLKAAKLNSNKFKELPKKEQLKFWKQFQADYPNVSVESEIAALREATSGDSEDEPEEKSEREQILENIEAKQAELDDWIERAKTTSAGRTFRRKYHLARKELQNEIAELKTKLKALPE